MKPIILQPGPQAWLSSSILSTFHWYMTGIPDLMDIAGSRFEGFALGEDGHV